MTTIHVEVTGNDTTGNGSAGAPYATVAKADSVAVAGDVILVGDGTYAGDIHTTHSGAAGNPITWRAVNKWGAKFTNQATGTAVNETIWWFEADHLVIDGFELFGNDANTSGTWRFGIYASGTDIVVQNCNVHDILRNVTAFGSAEAGNGSAGIEVDGVGVGVNLHMLNNLVYNQGPDGASSSTTGHGLYHTSSGSIKNNVVKNCAGVPIHLWHGANHVDVVNNTVDGSTGTCVLVGSGDSGVGPGTGDFCNVHNNIFMNADVGAHEEGQTGANNTYKNNLCFNIATSNFIIVTGQAATGTVVGDPLVVNAATRDYHLTSASPAKNAGLATLAPAIDFDGTARDASPDIGAYEFVAAGGGSYDPKKCGGLSLLGAG